jgi:glutamate formiminotransferase
MDTDFGPFKPHPTAGVVAIGARMPLVAYNVNLGTNNLRSRPLSAKKYAMSAEDCGSAKRWVWCWKIVASHQVSMNLTDYTKNSDLPGP